jgi:hypothetical protein
MLRCGRQLPLLHASAQPARPDRKGCATGQASVSRKRRRSGDETRLYRPDRPPGNVPNRQRPPREIPYLLLFVRLLLARSKPQGRGIPGFRVIPPKRRVIAAAARLRTRTYGPPRTTANRPEKRGAEPRSAGRGGCGRRAGAGRRVREMLRTGGATGPADQRLD